jgi:hypothetical protein
VGASNSRFRTFAACRACLVATASGTRLGAGMRGRRSLPATAVWFRGLVRMAAEPGIEPGLRDPNSPVLPLHHSATYQGRATSVLIIADEVLANNRTPERPEQRLAFHGSHCLSNLSDIPDCWKRAYHVLS